MGADQAISSLSNALLPLLIAGVAAPAQYGYFLTAYAALAFLLSISRGTLSVPISMASGTPNTVNWETGLALSTILLGGPIIVGLLVAVPLLAGSVWEPLYLLFAAGGLLTLVQDNLRYSGVAHGRVGLVLLGDVVWLGVISLAIPARLFQIGTPTLIVSLWVLGAVLAIVILFRRTVNMCGPQDVLNAWSLNAQARVSLVVAAVSAAGSVLMAGIVIARIAGPTTNAALGGAGQLMAPINLLVALLGFALLPAAARRTPAWSRNAFALAGGSLSVLAVLWGGLLLLLPYSVGTALLGDTWGSARDVILPVSIVSAAVVGGAAGATHLMRLSGESSLARLRLVQGTARIGSVVLVASLWGTALSLAVMEVLLTSLFAATVWLVASRYRH